MAKQNKDNITTERRIANRIKSLRIERKMSQKQLADACGYSNTTICNIERGGDYKISTLGKIEEVLNCTLFLVPNEDLI